MKNTLIAIFLLFALCSCATGPVYIAKTESEAIERVYTDQRSQKLYNANAEFFNELYLRYTAAKIGIYKDGLGIAILTDEKSKKLHYIKVSVRPAEVSFDGNSSTSEQRFSHALQQIPSYMKHIKSKDLNRDDIEGLAFGIYWAVRDFSQCNQYGGFVEYIQVFFRKTDAQDILDGRREYKEALVDAEVITSLELKPVKNVRPVF
ncbi:MAG: hypothetical protein C0399_09845 [Syntrophus sp. (in: bacteria)]|nr:hypothetical protein [Syntrophus sp. (in: bacteria)]